MKPDMQRRALLASLAASSAGLAGCAFSRDTDSGATTNSPVPTTQQTATESAPTEVESARPSSELAVPDGFASVIELETVARTYAFGPTRFHTDDEAEVALWFDRTATADHPARLRGWLRNRNDFENTFQIKWIPAVGRVHGRQPRGYNHEASLHLAPTENNDLATTVPDVARTGDGLWYATRFGSWMADTYRLAPGEHVELEYHVVGEWETPGRPTGTYEFTGRDETVTIVVWETESPGPEEPSRYAGRSTPPFEREWTVSWYHDADQTTPAFVQPSTEQLELDGLVEFEMVNNTRESLECGHWNLYKLVEGHWFHVGPVTHTDDCRVLRPGGRKSWSLRAFNANSVPCGTSQCGSGGFTRGYLGGGTYAVVVGYGYPSERSAALVELVGDSVTLVPTADARIERDGETVTVTMSEYGDTERPPDATLTLTRVGSSDSRIIAEQVMQSDEYFSSNRGLRNALSVVRPDVERVVVRTDDRIAKRTTGHDTVSRRFRFRGQAYEISRDHSDE